MRDAMALPLGHERPLKVLTWHVHGSYLEYLAYCGHDLIVPVLPGRPERFAGRPADATWPANVREMPADRLHLERFDAIVYQHKSNWTEDRLRWLSDTQLSRTPQALIEHDPPREHPTDTRHPVDDPSVTIVHVTYFNQLMWDCGSTPTRVIEHGVTVPADAAWTGELDRAVAVVNNIVSRGRRLGPDVLERMRSHLSVDLFGMGSEECGGLGERPHAALAHEVARYRFFFNPIRYTSLGLAVCEAMMLGAPVVGLATTEMSVAVENGVTGYVHTDQDYLAQRGLELLEDRALAARLGAAARERALERHGIGRFARDWDAFLRELAGRSSYTATGWVPDVEPVRCT